MGIRQENVLAPILFCLASLLPLHFIGSHSGQESRCYKPVNSAVQQKYVLQLVTNGTVEDADAFRAVWRFCSFISKNS